MSDDVSTRFISKSRPDLAHWHPHPKQATQALQATVTTPTAQRLDRRIFRGLFGFSAYLVPAVIALLSLWALISWPLMYPETEAKKVAFQALIPEKELTDPLRAARLLENAARVEFMDTHLSEMPVWFSFQIDRPKNEKDETIEFPSRHLTELACWDLESYRAVGQATRLGTQGELHPMRSGFAYTPDKADSKIALVCKAQFIGPARLTVDLWKTTELNKAARAYEHNSALLDGGLIVLSLFVFITALINRNSTYLLFSVWLIINLRMGALSAGWDVQWLGRVIPHELLLRIRLITVALQYAVTYTLYRKLFHEHLDRVGYQPLLRLAQWSCLPLLAMSLVLSYQTFLPIVWVAVSLGAVTLVFFVFRILMQTRSQVAVWYGASILIMLTASVYEVAAAAMGVKSLIGSVNSVTAALSSSLLASLAIAVQMREEHQHRLQAQAELEHAYAVIPIGLFTLNLDGEFLSANPALESLLGPAVLAPGSKRWDQYFQRDTWHRLLHMLDAQTDAEIELESNRDGRSAESKKFLIKATLAGDRIEGSLEDITERARATARLQYLAHHDPLTKILNRTGIQGVLEEALNRTQGAETLTLAYLDLDRFKLINHLYGHAAGDEILRQVSARVTNMLTGTMQLGRMGGDEFLLTMPNTRIAHATLLCQGIVNSISSRPYKVGDHAFHVRGSIGLIEVARGTSSKDAISTADRACREAKGSHGSHLVVFERDSKLFQAHDAEMRLVGQLSATSTVPDGLYLEMQPIMSLQHPMDSLNFEVLLRMRDANWQIVPTPRLIAAAEYAGRMGVIDRWVLSQSLSWLSAHQSELSNTLFVCMNLSGASLNDERFVQEVSRLLEAYPEVASSICLEITESIALHDLENTRRFIDRVRSLGAKVALDDFGAGYTSFSYLKDLPADLLKIDGSFIVNMNQHPANVAIVEAIVNLARNLGMKTIAEWAEDFATVQALADAGVDYVQGYAIARSMPPEKILAAQSSGAFVAESVMDPYLLTQKESSRGADTPSPSRFH